VAGNRPVNRGLGPVTRAVTVPPATGRVLRSLGSVGRAVRHLAATTAPPPAPRHSQGDTVAAGLGGSEPADAHGSSAVPAVLAATIGGTGGVLVPVVLVAAAVGAFAARRRRGRPLADD
jgi:hypothetical protein